MEQPVRSAVPLLVGIGSAYSRVSSNVGGAARSRMELSELAEPALAGGAEIALRRLEAGKDDDELEELEELGRSEGEDEGEGEGELPERETDAELEAS